MNCDTCQRSMSYSFHVDDEHWGKVIGKDKAKAHVGHLCAHCALEGIGGCSWYIIWNEPVEKARINRIITQREAAELK